MPGRNPRGGQPQRNGNHKGPGKPFQGRPSAARPAGDKQDATKPAGAKQGPKRPFRGKRRPARGNAAA
jgi:hypothetical protein